MPRPGPASFILHKDGVLWLTGDSDVIHALDHDRPLDLSTPEARADYVQLFMNWVRSPLGRFQPIETAETLAHRSAPATLAHMALSAAPWTIDEAPNEGGGWRVSGPMLYGGQIFAVEMRLGRNGMLVISEDTVLESNLALRRDYMTRLLLWLGAAPENDEEGEDT